MIAHVFKTVFRNLQYALLAGAVALIIFAFATWLPNLRLLFSILTDPLVSISDKVLLPINLLGSITTNFTALSASYTIAIALLFGINLAMVIYYVQRRIKEVEQSGIATGFLGITSGVVGMGCTACGSLLLTNILTLFGASWILSYLPLAGGEFGLLGVILLAVSIYLTAKKIKNPAVCKINPQ